MIEASMAATAMGLAALAGVGLSAPDRVGLGRARPPDRHPAPAPAPSRAPRPRGSGERSTLGPSR